MKHLENRRFPLFVETKGRKVLVIGGGKIATRRVNTLCQFDFEIDVLSPKISEEIKEKVNEGRVNHIEANYDDQYVSGYFIVTPCTDNSEVNKKAGEFAKKTGAFVSVADDQSLCDFFFPAIAVNDDITVGIAGSGKKHKTTRKAATKIRELVVSKAYEEE